MPLRHDTHSVIVYVGRKAAWERDWKTDGWEERKKVDGTRNPMLAVLSNNFLLPLFPHVYLHVLWRFCCRPWMAGNKNKNYTERMVIQWWDEEIKFVSNFFLTMTPPWFIRCIPRSLFVSSVVVPSTSLWPTSQSVSQPPFPCNPMPTIYIYILYWNVRRLQYRHYNCSTTTGPAVSPFRCLVLLSSTRLQHRSLAPAAKNIIRNITSYLILLLLVSPLISLVLLLLLNSRPIDRSFAFLSLPPSHLFLSLSSRTDT